MYPYNLTDQSIQYYSYGPLVGDAEIFPLIGTGWELLQELISFCEDEKVLDSRAIIPETQVPPKFEEFPKEYSFRDHIVMCIGIYKQISKNSHSVKL